MVKVQVRDVLKERDPIAGKCYHTEYFEFMFKDEELAKIEKSLKKRWAKVEVWEPVLCEEILGKIKYARTAEEFDLNKMDELPEVVLEIARLIKKDWPWSKREPKQKKLDT